MMEGLLTEGISIIVGIILTALGVSVYISKRATKFISSRKLKRGVFATSDVYDLLQKTQHRLGAKKALLVSAHNGGSFINPLHPPRITVLAEVYEHGLDPTKEHWQNRVADKGIINMLSVLLSEKRLNLTLKNTAPKGAVHRAMEKDQTEGIVMQYIGIVGTMLVYSSFAFEKHDELTNVDIVELEEFADKVKKRY